jgi:hypothetical protein
VGASIRLYRFRPLLLRALGVRFVITDGSLAGPLINRVATETGKDGSMAELYELEGANLGQFSPTSAAWGADYATAVAALRQRSGELDRRVLLLGAPERLPQLVPASGARLIATRDGYRVMAAAAGTAMLVLPIQFSHCWRVEGAKVPRIIRANLIQTGFLFKDDVDIALRFDFEPWRAACRLQDARDLVVFGFK